jgi:hypothetical protein
LIYSPDILIYTKTQEWYILEYQSFLDGFLGCEISSSIALFASYELSGSLGTGIAVSCLLRYDGEVKRIER